MVKKLATTCAFAASATLAAMISAPSAHASLYVVDSFAKPYADEGLNYPLALLAVPRKPDGTSVYTGPSDTTGQAAFDKAVSCSGRTVTFRLTTPMADFNQAVTLPVFAPVKKSEDKGADGTYAVTWRPPS